MYLVVIFLPFLGCICSGLLGRFIGVKGSILLSSLSVIIPTFLSFFIFLEIILNNTIVTIYLAKFLVLENFYINFAFTFDAVNTAMLLPVLIISSLVHIYSSSYMALDLSIQRFYCYLNLFTAMMLLLVTTNSYLGLFIGWEGIGISSYLLVNFWFTRVFANQGAITAILTNRIGDVFLTLGLFVLTITFGNLNYSTIFSLAPYISMDIIGLISILLFLAAMAKSSQILLHIWLPLAMEGPTPVSALIHAATLVTAGIFLLIRSSPLIEFNSNILLIFAWVGCLTTIISSIIGFLQLDIKKIIAYSTMAQLGLMVIAIGLSNYNLALYHLINHAFYKALLFLGAGAIIHALNDNQNLAKYGGLKLLLPLNYSIFLISSLSLIAFPFTTGFYSKDLILECILGSFTFNFFIIYFLSIFGAGFTIFYSIKIIYLTFLSNPNGNLTVFKKSSDGDLFLIAPLIILAILSIFFGYFTKDLFIGLGTNIYLDNSIFLHPNNEILLATEFNLTPIYKVLPLILSIILIIIYILITEFYSNLIIKLKYNRLGYNIYSFINQKFLIEAFYNKYIINPALNLAGFTTRFIDKGSVELIGPFGLEKGLILLANKLNINKSLENLPVLSLYFILSSIFILILPFIFSTYFNAIIISFYILIIYII